MPEMAHERAQDGMEESCAEAAAKLAAIAMTVEAFILRLY